MWNEKHSGVDIKYPFLMNFKTWLWLKLLFHDSRIPNRTKVTQLWQENGGRWGSSHSSNNKKSTDNTWKSTTASSTQHANAVCYVTERRGEESHGASLPLGKKAWIPPLPEPDPPLGAQQKEAEEQRGAPPALSGRHGAASRPCPAARGERPPPGWCLRPRAGCCPYPLAPAASSLCSQLRSAAHCLARPSPASGGWRGGPGTASPQRWLPGCERVVPARGGVAERAAAPGSSTLLPPDSRLGGHLSRAAVTWGGHPSRHPAGRAAIRAPGSGPRAPRPPPAHRTARPHLDGRELCRPPKAGLAPA